MRVMAIDYGTVRTGVAFSDLTGTLTGDAFTLILKSRQEVEDKLAALCEERGVTHIVLGHPKHMNGDQGDRAVASRQLAEVLRERTGLPVTLWDERLTSVSAHHILSENNRRGKRRKETVDAVAAALILEGFLGSL